MNMKQVVGVAIVAAMFGVGCANATPEDANQTGAAARGNMNEPSPHEDDDPGEQGEPPCEPKPVARMDGWTTHTNGRFSFQTPDTWKVNAKYSGNTDPAEGKFFGETQVTLKLATGTGLFARVGERLGTVSVPEDALAEMKAFPSTMPPSTTCVVDDTDTGTYRCDPMASSQITCHGDYGTAVAWWRFIKHGGRTFEAWCSGANDIPDKEATCAKVLASVQLTE